MYFRIAVWLTTMLRFFLTIDCEEFVMVRYFAAKRWIKNYNYENLWKYHFIAENCDFLPSYIVIYIFK